MKNSANIVIVIFIALILGCTCQSSQYSNSTQSNTVDNSATSPKTTDQATNKEDDDSSSTSNRSSSNRTPANGDTDEEDSASEENSSDKDPETNLPDKGIPTLAQFKKIRPGMSYDEVVDILGGDGTLVKQNVASKRYMWGDNDSFIMISFENEKVLLATQHNLK